MAGKPKEDLSEKQWKALRMLEAGGSSRKEIAAAIGVSVDYLGDLISGNTANAGMVADMFKKEWQKIESKRDENIKSLVKSNTEDVQLLMKRVVGELKNKKRLDHEEKKLLNAYNNSLSKSTPQVSIKNLSYSYTTGLTPEELIHEFTKLKSIAESSFDRRAVQVPGPRGSGRVSEVDESRDRLAEDS